MKYFDRVKIQLNYVWNNFIHIFMIITLISVKYVYSD